MSLKGLLSGLTVVRRPKNLQQPEAFLRRLLKTRKRLINLEKSKDQDLQSRKERPWKNQMKTATSRKAIEREMQGVNAEFIL